MKKHLEIVIRKQCDMVGADFDSIDFQKDDWYNEYQWMADQEKEYIEWVTDYLYNNREARKELMRFYPSKNKKRCRKAADQLNMYCGWKVK